jgi:hypothetical protein
MNMDPKLHDDIIAKISRHVDEDDLILEVCQRQGVSWNEAKTLIAEINAEHVDTIASRQLPLKTLIAFTTLAAGLILVILPTLFLVDLLKMIVGTALPAAGDAVGRGTQGQTSLMLAQLLMQQSPAVIPLVAAGVLNGLGMIFGSLLGMHETWTWFIDKVSEFLYQK